MDFLVVCTVYFYNENISTELLYLAQAFPFLKEVLCYKRMLFGLSSGVNCFQKITSILADIPGVLTYCNDVVHRLPIFFHDQQFWHIFKCLQQHPVTLILQKGHFLELTKFIVLLCSPTADLIYKPYWFFFFYYQLKVVVCFPYFIFFFSLFKLFFPAVNFFFKGRLIFHFLHICMTFKF